MGGDRKVFDVMDVLVIKLHKTQAIIRPKFYKRVEGRRFLSLNFYQSRGIYNLMTVKLGRQTRDQRIGRKFSKVLKATVDELRTQRDTEFPKSVITASKSAAKFRGGTVPKAKNLKIQALGMNETLTVNMPAYGDDIGPRQINCLMPQGRKNRHNEMLIALESAEMEYLAKLVVHFNQLAGNEADSTDDRGDDDQPNTETPLKCQTSILSFMSPTTPTTPNTL